jgi:hypothetical protein
MPARTTCGRWTSSPNAARRAPMPGSGPRSCSSSPRRTPAPGALIWPHSSSARPPTPAARPGTRSGWRGRRWASRRSATGRERRTPSCSTCSARPRGGWKRTAARWPCGPGCSRPWPAPCGTDRTGCPAPRSPGSRSGPRSWPPPRTTRAPWPRPSWRCTTRCGFRGPRRPGCRSSRRCWTRRGRAVTAISRPRRGSCGPRPCSSSATRPAGTSCSATSHWPRTWVTPGADGAR